MQNRRQFTRILFSIKANLTVEEQNYPVAIHDISLNGALITKAASQHSLKGKLGTLTFSLHEENCAVEMHIAVVHEGEDEMGLQCNAIDIDSVTTLRRLIELNLGDDDQLNKELSQLTRS